MKALTFPASLLMAS